jgi:hypothetical protein
MNYAVEMGLGAMICIPSFVQIGSGIQKLLRYRTQPHNIMNSSAYVYIFK